MVQEARIMVICVYAVVIIKTAINNLRNNIKYRAQRHFFCCNEHSNLANGVLHKTLDGQYSANIKIIFAPKSETEIMKRHKVCKNCSVAYCSLIKTGNRNSVHNFCNQVCILEFGVKTRKRNGTYIRTEEAKRKELETKKKHFGEDFGEKVKRANEASATRGLAGYDATKYNHWTQTPEGRKYVSNIQKNKKVSLETRHNMSVASSNRVKKNKNLYSNAKGGIRTDLNAYFRSTWEANYARILNYESIEWKYEAKTFQLDECL